LLLEHGGAKHNGPQSATTFQTCNNPQRRHGGNSANSSLVEVQLGNLQWIWSLPGLGSKTMSSGTPLHVAAITDNDEAAQMLLDAGAIIESLDNDLQTLLYVAAFYGNSNIIKLLLC
jgi:hypothetical protein